MAAGVYGMRASADGRRSNPWQVGASFRPIDAAMDDSVTAPGSPSSSETGFRPRGPDRRKRATPMISRYTFVGGRRRGGRREGETENIYVDVYSRKLVGLLLVFFALTVLDSVSTLVYLGKGGRELNPVAQWMIDQGAIFFVVVKGVLSGLCLLFVMLHKTFRPARKALALGFTFYLLLGLYHLVLQVRAL